MIRDFLISLFVGIVFGIFLKKFIKWINKED